MADDRDASRIGTAVEHLVAATCILISRSQLNVSTSLVDDEGVDLVFHRRNRSATLAVQVKARTMHGKVMTEKARFNAPVRATTFKPRADLYMLFVPVDADDGTYPFAWFVPSMEFRSKFTKPNGQGRFVFVASIKEGSGDRWSPFKRTRGQLPESIMDAIDVLDAA